jgi:hypothetical protein
MRTLFGFTFLVSVLAIACSSGSSGSGPHDGGFTGDASACVIGLPPSGGACPSDCVTATVQGKAWCSRPCDVGCSGGISSLCSDKGLGVCVATCSTQADCDPFGLQCNSDHLCE